MPGTLPPILGAKSGESSGRQTPRTSINSAARSSIHGGKQVSFTSIGRAQQAREGKEGHGPTTSIARMNQSTNTTTSINRKESSQTATSVYGRSRGIEDASADDKRYEYARRKIFAKKRQEQKKDLKVVQSKMKSSDMGARGYMKSIVKKYSWKKPLGEGYEEKERKEMKTKIDQAAKARHFKKSDVEKMKNLVDNLE